MANRGIYLDTALNTQTHTDTEIILFMCADAQLPHASSQADH